MKWGAEWSVQVQFVQKDQLLRDWQQAVNDAHEEIAHQRTDTDSSDESDPRFVASVLQRFVQLFRLNDSLSPPELLDAVRKATIPPETAQWLGKSAKAKESNRDSIRKVVEKYLSTKDSWWTIVESCTIEGPFDDWHPSLSVVDLPGTNDTDPQRTAVTTRIRETANAVAIVTSDSNLGPDIENWLRHSSVLSEFLEATRKRRQRLFVLRTKLDAFHPKIEPSAQERTDEEESALYQQAVDRYKQEQSRSYRNMLRTIAGPKLPFGDDETAREKRAELLARLDEVPVFFVSALAHEVFSNRYSAARRTQRHLSEFFDDDVEKTGIPALRRYFTEVAEAYLAENFYEDLEVMLESEVSLLADAFRKSIASTKAELVGGQEGLISVVRQVERVLLPWLDAEVTNRATRFRQDTVSGASGIRHRLEQTEAVSKKRFEDKIRIWSGLHWSSLRAVARKKGAHTTGRGQCIDISEDICSVLIDDVLLAWTHFRDHLISERLDTVTDELGQELTRRLEQLERTTTIPEVADAVRQISHQLSGITYQQRLEMLRTINDRVRQVESIRKPAYEIAAEEMQKVYRLVMEESGVGCSQRMGDHIRREAPAAIERIRRRINAHVTGVVDSLGQDCTSALRTFGHTAGNRIETAVRHVSSAVGRRDEENLRVRLAVIDGAAKRLPSSAS
jgi:hypothetical protein